MDVKALYMIVMTNNTRGKQSHHADGIGLSQSINDIYIPMLNMDVRIDIWMSEHS